MKYGSSSKHFYPGTQILINKLDIRKEDLLREAETLFSSQRLLELSVEPLSGSFDLQHLLDIHYYILQDIYYFAGKIRDEEISKGGTLFARSDLIVPCANKLFEELKSENYLRGTDVTLFADRVGYYMAEINMLHPFREGNGRAIREFIRCLALHCQFTLNWNALKRNELFEASVKSIIDTKPLAACIRQAIDSK